MHSEYFASKYVRMVTGFQVHDTTAGFKCYRRCVLEYDTYRMDASVKKQLNTILSQLN